MAKIALIVEFEIKPETAAAFRELMAGHARGTLEEEEGCLQFDLCVPQDSPEKLYLYEVYRDQAAFDVQRDSARLARTRESYKDMIVNRTIAICEVA